MCKWFGYKTYGQTHWRTPIGGLICFLVLMLSVKEREGFNIGYCYVPNIVNSVIDIRGVFCADVCIWEWVQWVCSDLELQTNPWVIGWNVPRYQHMANCRSCRRGSKCGGSNVSWLYTAAGVNHARPLQRLQQHGRLIRLISAEKLTYVSFIRINRQYTYRNS